MGLLLAGMFLAVVFAYACTEYLLMLFKARQRVMVGRDTFSVIVGSNVLSFAVLCLSSLIFVFASGAPLYLEATVVCLAAQSLWLAQHLWLYYRDHVRLRHGWPQAQSPSHAAE